MATLKAEVTDQDEPVVEVPSWGEVSSLPEFQNLSYPEQRRVALSWAEDLKREASYRGEFTDADAKQVDDFVASAVQPDLETKAKAVAEGAIRGGLSGTAATLVAKGISALPIPAVPKAILGFGGAAAAQIGVDELAKRGIEKFAPGLTEAAELAPGYASGGQVVGIAGSAAPAVTRTAQALGTIAKAEGGKAAVQQGARLLAPAAAIGAGVDTGIRALTGQEITPGSVATGAILNTLFAGYGANTRIANYTRDEARGLFQRVMQGNGSLKDTDDLLSIINQMKQQSPEGMPMQDFGRAQRTTVDVMGKRAVDRTTLEQPTFRTPPADEAAMLTGRRGPDPVVQRTPELPQAGVRGNVRGTMEDTGELQRRGVNTEMEQSLQLDQPEPRKGIFTTESQGINRQAIIPDTRGLQGELVSEGPTITPRRQLPTTEKLALTDAAQKVQIQPPEVTKIQAQEVKRQYVSMPNFIQNVGRDELGDILVNSPFDGSVSDDGKSIISFADPRNQRGKIKISSKEFFDWLNSDKVYEGLKFEGPQDRENYVKYVEDLRAKSIKGGGSIPRPFGKKGEAGMVTSDVIAKPAEAYKTFLTSTGDLPKSLFDIVEARGGQTNAMLKQVQFTTRDVQGEIKKALAGVAPKERGAAQSKLMEGVNAVIRGQAEPSTLPDNVASSVIQMRRQLDNLSDGLISSGVFSEELPVKKNEFGGYDVVGQSPAQRVRENKGEYLTRTYERDYNPKFSRAELRKRDPAKYAAAESALRDELKQNRPDITEQEISAELERISKYDQGPQTPSQQVTGLGKDLGITRQKKDIPWYRRYLMGETTDPIANYVISAGKMIELLQTQRMLNSIRADGLGKYLFEKPTGDAITPIAAEGSSTLAPLNGLFASEKLVSALKDVDAASNLNLPAKVYATVNSWVKMGKTVLSFSAQLRNPVANIAIEIANGNPFFTGAGKSVKAIWADWGVPSVQRQEYRTYLKKAISLGVYDNTAFNELRDIVRDAQGFSGDGMEFANKMLEKGLRKYGKAATIGWASATYKANDNFFKLMAWENEIKQLMDGLKISREEAEPMAAEIVKNTRPTYSRVPQLIKKWRQQPFFGNFISWPSEILRGMFNMAKVSYDQIRTPGMEYYGYKRALMGLATVTGLTYALDKFGQMMSGVTNDKMDALRRFVAPFQKNSELMPIAKDNKELSYIDVSYTSPWEIVYQPFRAALSGKDFEDSILSATNQFFNAYFSPGILTSAVASTVFGQTPSGKKIRNPEDMPGEQFLDTVSYFIRQIEPATASQIRRIYYGFTGQTDPLLSGYGRVYNANEESLALLGIRPSTINFAKALEGNASRFNKRMTDISRIFTEQYGSVGQKESNEIQKAYASMLRQRQKLFDDANQDFHAAIKLGLSRSEAISAMRAGGISEDNAIAISKNKYTDYQISRDLKQTMKETLKPDELRKREAIARELRIKER